MYREAKDSSVLPRVVLAYDNMCNLCRLRVAKSPLPLPPPLDKIWESVDKIIIIAILIITSVPNARKNFHQKKSNKKISILILKQASKHLCGCPGLCTLCAMNKTHHLFYLHRMVRRNDYTSKINVINTIENQFYLMLL